MKYYYLAASLPALSLGDKVPVTSQVFLEKSQNSLSPEDFDEARAACEGRLNECRSAFVKTWKNMETQLRNAVARIRAQKTGLDVRESMREHEGWGVHIEKLASDAMAEATPLAAEFALDRGRFRLLEEAAVTDPFGLPAVLSFCLRLRLVERWAAMNDKAGLDKVEAIIEENTRSLKIA